MSKLQPIFLVVLLLFYAHSSAQYEWRRKACPVLHQGGGSSFAIGNKAYVIGGDTLPPAAANICASVWEYDQATDTWIQKNNFPYTANNPACFVINDTAYVRLGLDNTSTYHNALWQYDQIHDQWVQKADFPGQARYGAMTFILHGKAYLGCGHGVTEYNDFYAYDPSANNWIQKANFPGAGRQLGIGGAVGDKGYMGLGVGSSQYADMYQYSDTFDSWSAITSFTNSGRYSAGSFMINDTLYVVGGMNSASYFHDCWSYNVSSDNWTSQADFSCLVPDSVFIQDGFVLNGHGYVRPLDAFPLLYTLLEFGPNDTSFTQHVQILGADTIYGGNFTRTLSVPDSCAIWSTGAMGNAITISSPDTYWVRWNVACGVASDTIILKSKSSGSDDVSDKTLIQAYPNPAFNKLIIETSASQSYKLYITNSLGQKIYTSNNYLNTDIDVNNWLTGLYIYHISTADGVDISGKVVIVH